MAMQLPLLMPWLHLWVCNKPCWLWLHNPAQSAGADRISEVEAHVVVSHTRHQAAGMWCLLGALSRTALSAASLDADAGLHAHRSLNGRIQIQCMKGTKHCIGSSEQVKLDICGTLCTANVSQDIEKSARDIEGSLRADQSQCILPLPHAWASSDRSLQVLPQQYALLLLRRPTQAGSNQFAAWGQPQRPSHLWHCLQQH